MSILSLVNPCILISTRSASLFDCTPTKIQGSKANLPNVNSFLFYNKFKINSAENMLKIYF